MGCSYATLSYITAYLRCHHPLEYMTSLLNASYDNKPKFLNAMKTCKNLGITIKPPRLSSLTEDCIVEGDAIRLGTKICKNLKNAGAYAIKSARQYPNTLFEFIEKVDRTKFNVARCATMVSGGLLDEFLKGDECRLTRAGLKELVGAYYEWFKANQDTQERWSAWDVRRKKRAEQEDLKAKGLDYGGRLVAVGKEPQVPSRPDPKDYLEAVQDLYDEAIAEYEILGCSIGTFPTELLVLPDKTTTIEDIQKQAEEAIEAGDFEWKGRFTICGIITQFKEKRTRNNTHMASFFLEDETGIQEMTLFPQAYTKIKDATGKPEDFKAALVHVGVKVRINNQGELEISWAPSRIEYPTKKKEGRLLAKTLQEQEEYHDSISFTDGFAFGDFLLNQPRYTGDLSYRSWRVVPKAKRSEPRNENP